MCGGGKVVGEMRKERDVVAMDKNLDSDSDFPTL